MNTTPNGAVALTVDDGIATITIHNAARANALTREMLTAMGGHLDAVATRSPVTLAAAKQMTDEAAAHGRVSDQLDRHWRTTPNPDLVAGLAAFTAGRTAQFRTT